MSGVLMTAKKISRARKQKQNAALLEAGTRMSNHLLAAMFHLAHGHEWLAIAEVRRSCVIYERFCRSHPNAVLPRELHNAFHASLDWMMKPLGLAKLALATCALIEWRAVTFHIDLVNRRRLQPGPHEP